MKGVTTIKKWYSLFFTILLVTLVSCSSKGDQIIHKGSPPPPSNENQGKAIGGSQDEQLKNSLIQKYANSKPTQWGEAIPGVNRHLNTNENVIALTIDACGGPHGSGYDVDIINYLNQMHIPATLFINSRWIDANQQTFMELARNPLFEIENHGYEHRPLSVNGRSAYGIKGTAGVGEVVDEVLKNHRKIEQLTGRAPSFFRSGTAFYDDIAVKIVHELGESPVGYDVLGDAGATFNTQQVKKALLSAKPGSIVILHMNQPKGDTAEGLKLGIPELIRNGYRFVKLTDYPLK